MSKRCTQLSLVHKKLIEVNCLSDSLSRLLQSISSSVHHVSLNLQCGGRRGNTLELGFDEMNTSVSHWMVYISLYSIFVSLQIRGYLDIACIQSDAWPLGDSRIYRRRHG